jgi:hypothetical protein
MAFRNISMAVATIGAFALAAALSPPRITSIAFAEETSDLHAQGLAALKGYWSALMAGTQEKIGPTLAAEFQIQREDGSGYIREGFLKSELPKIAAMPEFSDLTVTGSGDLLVARYYVTVNETIGGKPIQKRAPRLTVFRKQGNAWLAVAHANFAPLER